MVAPGSGDFSSENGPNGVAAFYGVSGAATLTTRYKLNTAKFYDSTVAPGQPATIALAVGPANNVRATLQHWNGKAWVSIKWVYLTKGVARYTFPAPGRGNTAYRFVVPPTTYKRPPGRRHHHWQHCPGRPLTFLRPQESIPNRRRPTRSGSTLSASGTPARGASTRSATSR